MRDEEDAFGIPSAVISRSKDFFLFNHYSCSTELSRKNPKRQRVDLSTVETKGEAAQIKTHSLFFFFLRNSVQESEGAKACDACRGLLWELLPVAADPLGARGIGPAPRADPPEEIAPSAPRSRLQHMR